MRPCRSAREREAAMAVSQAGRYRCLALLMSSLGLATLWERCLPAIRATRLTGKIT